MASDKLNIVNDSGQPVSAQVPVIVSASRSTDIPGFYADWFQHRLEKGYSAWTNPFNGVKSYVSYARTRLIVFWSKNPERLLKPGGLLDYLEKRGINSYIQFTLNDYVAEGLEKGVPSLDRRIDTFRRLVDRLGFGKVIWRFDPLMLTDTIDVDTLLAKASHIGNSLKGYTEKMVFSYADILAYRKVRNNLELLSDVRCREFSEREMTAFAEGLARLNEGWGFTLATCAEKIDLDRFGIVHNKCIDDDLMIKYFSDDRELMAHIGVEIVEDGLFGRTVTKSGNKNKDKGQRLFCGCIASKDIGQYNTCVHLCEYCYANSSKDIAKRNYELHQRNPQAETITGQ